MNQTKEEARLRVYLVNENSLSDNPSLEYLRELQWYVKVWLGQIDKFLEETIKAQPTTVPIKKAIRLKYESGFKLYWNPEIGASGGWSNKPFWSYDIEWLDTWLAYARKQTPLEQCKIKLVHIKCKCTTPQLDRPQRYHTINCPLSKPR